MISTPISASNYPHQIAYRQYFPLNQTLSTVVSKHPNLSELVAISRETFQKQSRSRLNTTIDHHLQTWIMSTLLLIAGSEIPVVCRG